MEEDKDQLLYRVFKEDAIKRDMDIDDFYHKRRKGLLPFLNFKGEVEWLKREEYKIAAVKKRIHVKKSNKSKHRKHIHHHEKDEIKIPITPDMYKYFFMGVGTAFLVYIFIKFLELL